MSGRFEFVTDQEDPALDIHEGQQLILQDLEGVAAFGIQHTPQEVEYILSKTDEIITVENKSICSDDAATREAEKEITENRPPLNRIRFTMSAPSLDAVTSSFKVFPRKAKAKTGRHRGKKKATQSRDQNQGSLADNRESKSLDELSLIPADDSKSDGIETSVIKYNHGNLIGHMHGQMNMDINANEAKWNETSSKRLLADVAKYNSPWAKATIGTPGNYFIDPYLIPTDVDTRYIYKGMPLTKEHFDPKILPKILPSETVEDATFSERTESKGNGSSSVTDQMELPPLEDPSKMLMLHKMEVRSRPLMIKKRFFEAPDATLDSATATMIREVDRKVDRNDIEIGETNFETSNENIEVSKLIGDDCDSALQIIENAEPNNDGDDHLEATETETVPAECSKNDDPKPTSISVKEIDVNSTEKISVGVELQISIEDPVKELISRGEKKELKESDSQIIIPDKELEAVESNSSTVVKDNILSLNSSSAEQMEDEGEQPDLNGNVIVDEFIPKAIDIIKERQEEELEELNSLYKLEKSTGRGLENMNVSLQKDRRSFINPKCTEIDYKILKADCSDDVKLLHKYLFTDNSYTIDSVRALHSKSGESLTACAKESMGNENTEIPSKQIAENSTEDLNETLRAISQTRADHLSNDGLKQVPDNDRNDSESSVDNYSQKVSNEANLNKSLSASELSGEFKLHEPKASESVQAKSRSKDDSERDVLLLNLTPITVIDNYSQEMYEGRHYRLDFNEQEIDNYEHMTQIFSSRNSMDIGVEKPIAETDKNFSEIVIEEEIEKDESLLSKNQETVISIDRNVPLQHTCECMSYFLDKNISNQDKIARKREIHALCLETEPKRYKRENRRMEDDLKIVFDEQKSIVEDEENIAVNDENPKRPIEGNDRPLTEKTHCQTEKVDIGDSSIFDRKKRILDSIENLIDNYHSSRFMDVKKEEIGVLAENNAMTIDNASSSSQNDGGTSQAFNWKQDSKVLTANCDKPLRLGLSRKTKTKPLHPNLYKNRNFRI